MIPDTSPATYCEKPAFRTTSAQAQRYLSRLLQQDLWEQAHLSTSSQQVVEWVLTLPAQKQEHPSTFLLQCLWEQEPLSTFLPQDLSEVPNMLLQEQRHPYTFLL